VEIMGFYWFFLRRDWLNMRIFKRPLKVISVIIMLNPLYGKILKVVYLRGL